MIHPNGKRTGKDHPHYYLRKKQAKRGRGISAAPVVPISPEEKAKREAERKAETARLEAERIKRREAGLRRAEALLTRIEAGELPTRLNGEVYAAADFLEAFKVPSGESRRAAARRRWNGPPDRAILEESILDGSALADPVSRTYALLRYREILLGEAAGTVELLGPGDVCKRYGMARMTLKRLRDRGEFPAPLGRSSSGPIWRADCLPAEIGRYSYSPIESEDYHDAIPF